MNTDRLFTFLSALVYLGLAAVLILVIAAYYTKQRECDQQRGLMVQTPSGWYCLEGQKK